MKRTLAPIGLALATAVLISQSALAQVQVEFSADPVACGASQAEWEHIHGIDKKTMTAVDPAQLSRDYYNWKAQCDERERREVKKGSQAESLERSQLTTMILGSDEFKSLAESMAPAMFSSITLLPYIGGSKDWSSFKVKFRSEDESGFCTASVGINKRTGEVVLSKQSLCVE